MSLSRACSERKRGLAVTQRIAEGDSLAEMEMGVRTWGTCGPDRWSVDKCVRRPLEKDRFGDAPRAGVGAGEDERTRGRKEKHMFRAPGAADQLRNRRSHFATDHHSGTSSRASPSLLAGRTARRKKAATIRDHRSCFSFLVEPYRKLSGGSRGHLRPDDGPTLGLPTQSAEMRML